jgi:hypothetical protein
MQMYDCVGHVGRSLVVFVVTVVIGYTQQDFSLFLIKIGTQYLVFGPVSPSKSQIQRLRVDTLNQCFCVSKFAMSRMPLNG